MLVRWGIRLLSSLIGIGVGIAIAAIALGDFDLSFTGLVEATILFWIVHLIVSFLALRILVRQPSVAMVGLLALGATVVSLIIVSIIVGGVKIHGPLTYIVAAIIIWITTAIGDFIGRRMIRERRQERRDR
jgi:CDP-diglyceride synthetase